MFKQVRHDLLNVDVLCKTTVNLEDCETMDNVYRPKMV